MPGLKKKELRTEKDLTIKQKMFIDILVANWGEITKSDALRKAKYECKNDNDYSVIASRLTNRRLNPHICKYLDKKLDEASSKYERNKIRRYRRLERFADSAAENKQYSAAVNAEYRSGQLAGLYIDKKEVKVSGLEGMSRAELEKKLKELSNKIDGFNAKTIEVEPETDKISQKL